MKLKITNSKILVLGLLSLVTGYLSACKEEDLSYNTTTVTKPDVTFVALTNSSSTVPSTLIRYNASNVNQVITSPAPYNITGLQTGENIIAIDYRPATKVLYGISNASRLYTLTFTQNPTTKAFTGVTAALVGTGPITPALSGSVAAFDFNPVADRLRVITVSGQNLRINPTDATVTVDGSINGVTDARITGSAYTNSIAGATTTELYDLDVAAQKLYKQNANAGTLTLVGSLGLTPILTTNPSYSAAYNTNITTASNNANAGFDIGPSGVALAVFMANSAPAIPVNGISAGNPSSAVNAVSGALTLFEINLETGMATDLGVMPIPAAANYAAASSIIGLAIVP